MEDAMDRTSQSIVCLVMRMKESSVKLPWNVLESIHCLFNFSSTSIGKVNCIHKYYSLDIIFRIQDYTEFTANGVVKKQIREFLGKISVDVFEDEDEDNLVKVTVLALDTSMNIKFKDTYSRVDDKNRFKSNET